MRPAKEGRLSSRDNAGSINPTGLRTCDIRGSCVRLGGESGVQGDELILVGLTVRLLPGLRHPAGNGLIRVGLTRVGLKQSRGAW